MQKAEALIFALASLFTIALFSVTFVVEDLADNVLSARFPELTYPANLIESVGPFRPFGYVAFSGILGLILCGFLFKRSRLITTGSFALLLPTFGYFAVTMFMLAGIGVLRALWLPLFDLSCVVFGFDLRSGPGYVNLLNLGQVVYLPFLVCGLPFALAIWWTNPWLLPLQNDIGYVTSLQGISDVLKLSRAGFWLSEVAMAIGIFVFLFGTFTWLYGKYKGHHIVDFWIYRSSRHPQYLGFLLWSYGIMVYTSLLPTAMGGYVPEPSFPWLVSAMLVIGVAFYEESMMAKKYGERYVGYRERTPFMLPLPRRISTLLMAPCRILFKKRWPEDRKEIAAVLLIYCAILAFLSLPIIWFYPLLFYP